uniref:Uncharacterized protein n=1 Tax=Podoviridae sp. ctBev14 TaxID=2823556 RepID=A0A8S5LAW5_9CAUD|nr:MAG TPA: hypothetical protein [Podoviridae sp. ctBev14]
MAELPEIKAMSTANSVSVKNSNRGGGIVHKRESVCIRCSKLTSINYDFGL